MFHATLLPPSSIRILTERLLASSSFEWTLAASIRLITPLVLAIGAMLFRWIERPCVYPGWPQRWKVVFASSSFVTSRPASALNHLSTENK
jgi:hypothetical protein